MQEIKCPNCGAPAQNHKNCEFCGSLLVRFANKGVDLTNTSYLNNDGVLPGLIKELNKNLELQQKNNKAYVLTSISKIDKRMEGGLDNFCGVINSTWLQFLDGQKIFPEAKSPSLGIVFTFYILPNSSATKLLGAESKIKNLFGTESKVTKLLGGTESTVTKLFKGSRVMLSEEMRVQKEKFEQLSSFPLFESKVSRDYDEDSSTELWCYQYAIDFGQDVEGAARLISEIANKVFDCPLNSPLIYDTITQEEQEAIEKENTKKEIIKNIWWIVLAVLGFLVWLIL